MNHIAQFRTSQTVQCPQLTIVTRTADNDVAIIDGNVYSLHE
jgi:hypothetical protein